MKRRWTYKPVPGDEQTLAFGKSLNLNPYLTTILLQRGISNFDDAKKFFRPSLDQLHDPFLLKGMERAIARLKEAIDNKEKILVYGDYDVDGTTAVAVVYSFLKKINACVEFYIPDRHSEGYGVSDAGFSWAVENGFTLIVTLDLGIKASAIVNQANFSGIDFIICDHHLPDDEAVPQAIAVLDPKQQDCPYPFKELTGCGLGFKLIQAFSQRHLVNTDIYQYLDLVAVSIASDIVPITGENRVLAYFGLKKLNEEASPGLKALKDIAGIKNELDISGIVFTLGPRINSAGRVAHAKTAVELLTSSTENDALILAEKLNTKNDLRRSFDLTTTEEALAMIEESPSLKTKKSTVLFKPTWHKGVIGIVAARCVEKYYRPTVILTESNEKLTGSARSIPEFDLYEALLKCGDLFEKFGGHKHAAGLTLDKKNLSEFEKRFEESVSEMLTEDILIPKIEIDYVLNFNSITARFVNVLKQFAPFGPENQKPIFESKNVFIANGLSNIKEKHVKFLAAQEGCQMFFNAIGFDMLDYFDQLKTKKYFNIVYTIEENFFNDKISIQLRLKDIKFDV